MLKKINRIGQKKEFLEVKNKGKMLNSPLFGAIFLIGETEDIKFGFVISKKISKRAVDRNKIKRRLMEVLGRNVEKFDEGKRIVFLAKKEVLEIKPKEIEVELKKIFGWRNKP